MEKKMLKQGLEVRWWLTELRQSFKEYSHYRTKKKKKIVSKTIVYLQKIELLINAILNIVTFQREEDKEMRPSERIW